MRSLVVGSSRGKLIFVLAFAACTLPLAPWPALAGGAARTAELKAGATLKRIAVIDLPGPPGRRFDYLEIDDEDRYLFAAHLAAGLLYVIDLRTSTLVKAIPDAGHRGRCLRARAQEGLHVPLFGEKDRRHRSPGDEGREEASHGRPARWPRLRAAVSHRLR